MSKYFNFKGIAFFFSVIFFMSSCSSDEKNQDDTSNSPASTATATSSNPVTAPTGFFDNLYIVRDSFDALDTPQKIVFCHKFATDNKVHLDGWVLGDGDGFKTPPDMPLANGDVSNVSYGADFYFGNIVIHRREFNKIKNALKDTNKKFVLFKPRKVGDHHIGYDIFVRVSNSFTIMEADDNKAAVAEANPSPPKNYSN